MYQGTTPKDLVISKRIHREWHGFLQGETSILTLKVKNGSAYPVSVLKHHVCNARASYHPTNSTEFSYGSVLMQVYWVDPGNEVEIVLDREGNVVVKSCYGVELLLVTHYDAR